MILRALGAKQCDLRGMRLLCPTTSIWTIDLAHLLRRFCLDVTFCTVTLGANPDFAHEVRLCMHLLCDTGTLRNELDLSRFTRTLFCFVALTSRSMSTAWRKTSAVLNSCLKMPQHWASQ